MAHHISREITLTKYFTENTDITLNENRHMMLHEIQKITQEMINMKVNLHRNEEKCKRLEVENDIHLQKLLEEMKEMKLYINELEMEKQRAKAENNEIKTQVADIREKQNQEINELRKIISGQETKISELETECCQMKKQNTILKMLKDSKSRYWDKSVELMRRHLDTSTQAYKQMNNIIDYYNYPLVSAERGYKEIIQVMLENGLPVNTPYTVHSFTMLHIAAFFGHYKLVKLFIQRGADVNVRESHGTAPLHRAAHNGHKKIVRLLVESGADIDATDIYGETPLHYATKYGHESVVQCLVYKGCDTTITDEKGRTAADIAAKENVKKILQESH